MVSTCIETKEDEIARSNADKCTFLTNFIQKAWLCYGRKLQSPSILNKHVPLNINIQKHEIQQTITPVQEPADSTTGAIYGVIFHNHDDHLINI